MNEAVKEILSLAESEAKWFHDTALTFEHFAEKLKEEEKVEWDLLASVYRERAQIIQGMLEKVREDFAHDRPSELRLENG